MQKCLFIGESSSLSFLLSRIASFQWSISLITLGPAISNKKLILNYHFDNNVQKLNLEYRCHSLEQFNKEAPKTIRFSLVFISSSVIFKLQEYAPLIQPFIMGKTSFVSDSCIFGDLVLKTVFPNNTCVCLYSEVECFKLGETSYKVLSKQLDYLLGCSTTELFSQLPLSEDSNTNLSSLINTYNSQNQGRLEISSPKSIKTAIWKGIIAQVCIDCLSIIFEEPNVILLSEDNSTMSIMKGLYKELISLSDQLKIGNIASQKLTAAKCLRGLIHKEAHKRHNRMESIQPNQLVPQNIHAPKLFYDYTQNHPLDIIPALNYLLREADKVKLNMPFLESLKSFLQRFIDIRKDSKAGKCLSDSKLFKFEKKYNSFPQYEEVCGIPPEKNMMNYPPFIRLPNPTPPKFYNTITKLYMCSHYNENNNDSNEVDPELKELIRGREELTFGHESNANLQPSDQNQQFVQQNQHLNHNASPFYPGFDHNYVGTQMQLNAMQQNLNPNNLAYPQNSETHHQCCPNATIPQTPFFSPQQNLLLPGSVPIQLPNGGTYFPPPVVQTVKEKPQQRYRGNISINRNTSSKQLSESHSQLMESVNFNNYTNQIVSNRYGEYDTSSIFLRSSENSSKASKASTSATRSIDSKLNHET